MKNRFFKFIKMYIPLFLADIVLIIGLILSKTIWGNKDLLGIDMMHWSASGLYLLYSTIIYPFFRGILSFLFYKKIWIPNIILFFITWSANIFINLDFRLSSIFSFNLLTWPLILFILSCAFSLITSLIVKIVKSIK